MVLSKYGTPKRTRGILGVCKSLYGTSDAAYNWTEAYTKFLVKTLGFEKGVASPRSFYPCKRKIKVAVHSDDFVSEGVKKELLWPDKSFCKEISRDYRAGRGRGQGAESAQPSDQIRKVWHSLGG